MKYLKVSLAISLLFLPYTHSLWAFEGGGYEETKSTFDGSQWLSKTAQATAMGALAVTSLKALSLGGETLWRKGHVGQRVVTRIAELEQETRDWKTIVRISPGEREEAQRVLNMAQKELELVKRRMTQAPARLQWIQQNWKRALAGSVFKGASLFGVTAAATLGIKWEVAGTSSPVEQDKTSRYIGFAGIGGSVAAIANRTNA